MEKVVFIYVGVMSILSAVSMIILISLFKVKPDLRDNNNVYYITGLWLLSLLSEFCLAFKCEADFRFATETRVDASKLSLECKRNCFELTVKYV